MKKELIFIVKLYFGVAVMTMFCIWNANRGETENYKINDNVIVMNEK